MNDPLSALVALSESMLRCAEAGDWAELAALEEQRRALLGSAMSLPNDNGARAGMAQVVRRILELDAKTTALAQAGRDDLAGRLRAMNLGRSAVSAYRQTR